jgi:hypothetical protein
VGLVEIIVLLDSYLLVLPDVVRTHLPENGLSFSLIMLGLIICQAQFFKKGKFKWRQLLMAVPFLLLALAANLCLRFTRVQPDALNFEGSFQITRQLLVSEEGFNWRAFFWGQEAFDFADVYRTRLSSGSIIFHQTASTPCTIFIMFGFFAFLSWLILIVFVFLKSFSKKEPQSHLFFILFLSLLLQMITPIYPLILFIQALLMASAVTRRRSIWTDWWLKIEGQWKRGRWEKMLGHKVLAGVVMMGVIWWGVGLARAYLGYYYYQKALDEEENLGRLADSAELASQIAPFIDDFQSLSGVAKLEVLIEALENNEEVSEEIFYQAVDNIELAIELNPDRGDYYLTLALLYQEIIPYLDEESRAASSQKIPMAYAEAIARQPQEEGLYLRLADYFLGAGDFDGAANLYQAALALEPNSIEARFGLGGVWEAKGDFIQARSVYADILNLLAISDPNYQENYDLVRGKMDDLK